MWGRPEATPEPKKKVKQIIHRMRALVRNFYFRLERVKFIGTECAIVVFLVFLIQEDT